MAVILLERMLSRYDVQTAEAREQALREVMQEIALAGLNRAGFFERAAFYGGTCLRIFHGLPRFSEDLDFSLLQADETFSLEPFFKAVKAEFTALGLEVEFVQKRKTAESQIASAFLKSNTQVFDIRVGGARQLKIKFEVDTLPPTGFETEQRLLLQPFSFHVRCFALPDLFAGKLHALLYRQWKNRVKGRDWFDFEWYVRNGVKPNIRHFAQRAMDSGDLSNADNVASLHELQELLRRRIHTLDIQSAKQDVIRFLADPSALDIWSVDYFSQLVDRLG